MLSLLIRALTGSKWDVGNNSVVEFRGSDVVSSSDHQFKGATRKAENLLASDDPQSDRFQNHLKTLLCFFLKNNIFFCL